MLADPTTPFSPAWPSMFKYAVPRACQMPRKSGVFPSASLAGTNDDARSLCCAVAVRPNIVAIAIKKSH